MGKSRGLKAMGPSSSCPLSAGGLVSPSGAVFTEGRVLMNMTQSSSAGATKSSRQNRPTISWTWT